MVARRFCEYPRIHSVATRKYYVPAAELEINATLHFVSRTVLRSGLSVLHGFSEIVIPDSVQDIETPVIVAGTHRSWEDIPRTVFATRKAGIEPLRFLYKAEYQAKFGGLFQRLGGIAVDRDTPNVRGINTAMQAFMRRGDSVAYFPEGTRVRSSKGADTRRLGDMKMGASALSVESGRPIIPLAIAGVADNDRRPKVFDRKPIVAVFGEPIHPETNGSSQDKSKRRALIDSAKKLQASLQVCLDEAYAIRDAA